MSTRTVHSILLACALLGLSAGLAFHFGGQPELAALAWSAGTGVVLLALTVIVIISLTRGEFGLDILAAISMSGALIVGEPLAGNVVALMFAGGQVLEDYAQRRAQREMTSLLARVPRFARRKVQGRIEEVPLDAIAPGDCLLIRPGDVIPVDGAVVGGLALLDQSALTGEAMPVSLSAADEVMSGSTNVGGAFDLRAKRTASESTYAGIVRLVEAAQRSKAPMSRLADRYALGFLALSLALAGGTWLLTHDQVRTLAVLIVATPCPLILAVPVAIVAGMSRCAHSGVLIKSAKALEQLARARILLFDKTGTLTGGLPTIVRIEAYEPFTEAELLRCAASLAQGSHHVVSAALVAEAKSRGLELEPPAALNEENGAGLHGAVATRAVTLGTYDLVLSHALLADEQNAGWAAAQFDAVGQAGSLSTFVGINGQVAGMIVLADELRVDALDALNALKQDGVARIVLVTGDRLEIANSVGQGLPIDRIVAAATPARKVEVVKEEAKAGISVMVGDGINDAPALAAADVGVSMGARGAAASSEAADAVILVDKLDRLPIAIRIARRSRSIALQSVYVGMGLSILGMIAAALGHLTPLEGALMQEAIDVAVVLNALRALTSGRQDSAKFSASHLKMQKVDADLRDGVLDRAGGVP